jgi:imidazolonepropionase-like amidohydrolase
MPLALTGAHVWDGRSPTLSDGPQSVFIDAARVVEVCPEGQSRFDRTANVRVLDLTGCVVTPGLIDAHVHLSLDPKLLSPDDQLKVPAEERVRAMEARALAMLRAGITTARDLGAGDWAELALRDRIARGEVRGPRLICAGQPITTPGGHCHFWGGVAEGRDEQRAVIERQLEHGVDWIKLMATGGVFTKGTGPARAQFSLDDLRAMVEQATQAGLATAAHCHGSEGIERAARAGVRTIEHCSFAGPKGFGLDLQSAVAAAVAEQGAIVSPTVNGGWGKRIEHEGGPSDFFERMSRVFEALRSAGVSMIASTDAGIPGVVHDQLAAGLQAFSRYAGLSPVETLRSATSESAQALGLGDACGVLEVGAEADLLVVDGNPLEDLSALERPVLVIARGELVPLANAESDPAFSEGSRPPRRAPGDGRRSR